MDKTKLSNEEKVICKILFESLTGKCHDIDNFKRKLDFKKIKEIGLKQKIFPIVFDGIVNCLDVNNIKEYQLELAQINLNSKLALQQIKEIDIEFNNNDICYAISKGLSISKRIYKNSLSRICGDIDIIVRQDDFLKSCKILEILGYHEQNYILLNKIATKKIEKEEFYLSHSNECLFVKNGFKAIELKTNIQYIEKDKTDKWLVSTDRIEINGVSFNTFGIWETFENCIVNSFKNLCLPYGIKNDYRLRDLIEPLLFITKYKDIIKQNFDKILEDDQFKYKMVALLDIFVEFFSEEIIELLPPKFNDFSPNKYNLDFMIWKSNIFSRFFNEEKRNAEHMNFRIVNFTKRKESLPIDATNKKHLSVENGMEYFKEKIKYSFEMCGDDLFLKYYIPNSMENVIISQKILKNQDDEKCVVNNIHLYLEKRNCLCDSMQYMITMKTCSKYKIISILFNKKDIAKIKNDSSVIYMATNFYICIDDETICISQLGNEFNFNPYIV